MKRGFSILEALAATGLLLLALRFCLLPMLLAGRGSAYSEQRLHALDLAREWLNHDSFAATVEEDRSLDSSWTSHNQPMHCIYQLHRRVVVAGPRLKTVCIQIGWQDGDQLRQVILESQVFNPVEEP